jgi:hypothetical protein
MKMDAQASCRNGQRRGPSVWDHKIDEKRATKAGNGITAPDDGRFGLSDDQRGRLFLFSIMGHFFNHFGQKRCSMEWFCEKFSKERIQTSLRRPDYDFLIMALSQGLANVAR